MRPEPEPEAVVLSDELREQKLAKLLEIEGYDNVEDIAEAVFSDAVSPAICANPDCNYTCEMEPDQDRGWCDECRTNTMVAALVLAEMI
jgi:hypothetical protein